MKIKTGLRLAYILLYALSKSRKNVLYKDGIYEVKHKSYDSGYEEVIVTIKDMKIQSIDLKRLDDNQKEIKCNDWDYNAVHDPDRWKTAVSSALEKAE